MGISRNRLSLVPPKLAYEPDHRTESAPFCPRAFLISVYQSNGWLVGAVGIGLKATLKIRKLLILLNAKNAKNIGFAQPRYTPGTRTLLEVPRHLNELLGAGLGNKNPLSMLLAIRLDARYNYLRQSNGPLNRRLDSEGSVNPSYFNKARECELLCSCLPRVLGRYT